MDLFIYTSYLGYIRCMEDELFVRTTKNKFQPHIILFTKYLALLIIECKIHHGSLKKKTYKI